MDWAGMDGVLDQLKGIFGTSPEGENIVSLFGGAYWGHQSLAAAIRYFVHRLLGKYGLLILDGDDPNLKALFAGIIKKDMLGGVSNQQVTATDERLQQAGYKVQAHSREINFFYLEKGLRERIVEENGQYHGLNTETHFSREDLMKEIDDTPEKFSPNVNIRQLNQEKILHNMAIYGGWITI